jgi:hypothetical protein
MNKTLIVINVILTILVFVWNVQSYSPLVQASTVIHVSGVSDFDGIGAGSGFQLQGKSGLIALADFVNRGSGVETSGVTFTLVGDVGTPGLIDFNNSGISPIGYDSNNFRFQGTFDGSGIIIENLNVVGTNAGAGFFGATEGATLRNINLNGVIVNSGTTLVQKVASLVGIASTTIIEKITIRGNLSITGQSDVAGLIGRNSGGGNLTNLNVDAETIVITSTGSSSSNSGGLVGFNIGPLSNSSLTANQLTLLGSGNQIGGLVGITENAPGALSFVANSTDNLSLNVNSLNITGTTALGGIIGRSNRPLTNSYLSGVTVTIKGTTDIGGFVGYSQNTLGNSYAKFNHLSLSGNGVIGGFIGGAYAGTVENTYISSEIVSITGTNSNTNLGGFVGYKNQNIIRSYLAIEQLTMVGNLRLGGFVGNAGSSSTIGNTFIAISGLTVVNGTYNPFVGVAGGSITYSYFNSGITGGVWLDYNNQSGSGIDEINATALLGIINSGINPVPFQLVNGANSGLYFPVLVQSGVITLANQEPKILIYWLEEPAPEPEPTVTPPPSQPSPGFNNPSQGETYTYDPVFLTLEFSILESEVGEPFVFDYRGFSTFGPIIKDYTSDVVITGTVNENVVGTYPVTLSLSAEGLTIIRTFTIQIVDTTPPVISGPTNVRLFVGEAYEGQITASDNVEEPITLTLLSTLDTSTAGITEVTWQATDASGNVSTLTQTVNVVVPEVQVQTVSVNNQTFIFTASEADYDLTQLASRICGLKNGTDFVFELASIHRNAKCESW